MNSLNPDLVIPMALVAVLALVTLRLFVRTIRVGLLLALPALAYFLSQH